MLASAFPWDWTLRLQGCLPCPEERPARQETQKMRVSWPSREPGSDLNGDLPLPSAPRRENPYDAVVFHPKFVGKTLETLPEKR